MLNVMNQSTQEEHSSQPLRSTSKQFKIAVTSLCGYIGSSKVTKKIYQICSTRSTNDKDISKFSLPIDVSEIRSLNAGGKRNILEKVLFTGATHPCKMRPKFSTLGVL